MTKHLFRPAPNRAVDLGWDRPCGHFYLNITDPTQPEDEDQVYISLYDNTLYDRARGPFMAGLTLDELQRKLEAFDIPLPDGLLEHLQEDQRLNRGNDRTPW